ncbi:MAG TPA: phosphatase PAP2 family protein [Candidatus Saccharimonadia bacterium]|nr:phosphatase PAP2 family protein [Candidatus Saccharimonadia bacterium]
MNELIIICAKYLFIVSLIAVVVYWWRLPRADKKPFLVLLVVGGVLSYALAKLSGHFIYDARPFVSEHITPLIPHANDNGFPSDHTLLTSWLAWVVLAFSRKWGAALLAVAVVVGAARVMAGIHHPLDIAGALAVTGLATLVAWWSLNKWLPQDSAWRRQS